MFRSWTEKELSLPRSSVKVDAKSLYTMRRALIPKSQELICASARLSGAQRICLSFDEVKIQENLVFDKYTGNLVGFVDLGDTELNTTPFNNTDKLASHVMLFYVRSLAENFKFSFSYFATDGMSAYQLMVLFWDDVSILEITCHLIVICYLRWSISKRKIFQMS